MSVTGARMALASEVHEKSARTRAWRPFPAGVADILCVENAHEDVAPRMHDRLSMTVVRTAGVIRCESTRSLVAAPSCVLLVPALQLYSLRAQGSPAGSACGLITDSRVRQRPARASIERFIRPVCSGAMWESVPAMSYIGQARS